MGTNFTSSKEQAYKEHARYRRELKRVYMHRQIALKAEAAAANKQEFANLVKKGFTTDDGDMVDVKCDEIKV